jgi:hypothetical protein
MMRDSVARALKDGPLWGVTGEHCDDCKARHVCGALQATTHMLMDYSKRAEARDLTGVSLGRELRWLEAAVERLEARRSALAVQAEVELRNGQQVPFYHMEPVAGRLKWNEGVTADFMATMGSMYNVNVRKPPEVVTPTQAIGAGMPEEVIRLYASRGASFMKLKPDDSTQIRKALGIIKT